jgi:hypothetical protein
MLSGPPYTLGYAVLNKEFLAAFRTGAACYEDRSYRRIEDETRAAVRANDAVLVKFKLRFSPHVEQYKVCGMGNFLSLKR